MPLYEYECQACGHRFERIQTYSDPIVKKCPRCGKRKVKKLLSSPAIRFKGSGFYITDYQRKGSGTSLPDHSEADKKKDAGDKESDKSGKTKDAGDKESDKSGKTSKPKPAKKD